jgi:aspartyl-tRNA(Asn)/glutamyl-tRNA(Gln) amidotransferase subunit B
MEAISDVPTIEGFARQVMEANADKVEQYRSGKQQLAGFFVGQTMVASGSRADPETLQRVVRDMLNNSS